MAKLKNATLKTPRPKHSTADSEDGLEYPTGRKASLSNIPFHEVPLPEVRKREKEIYVVCVFVYYLNITVILIRRVE